MPKIGIILAVDGEREFREAMTNATTAASAMKAQLKEVTQEYANNANSLEALQAKDKALKAAQEALQKSTSAARDGMNNAQKAVDKYTDAISKQDSKISEAKKELDRLKKTYGEGSDEVKKQEQVLDDLNREQDENKRALQAAENGLNKWKKKVADATTAETKNSQALDKNSQYLEEAENSADGCAKSIDKFGKETKEASEEVETLGDKLESAFTDGVGYKIADLAGNALVSLKDALVDGAKAAVEVGSQFEASMSNVAALSGATGSTLDQLSEKAQNLGRTTKFSASEAADAFGYMSLAGWDTNQMLDGIDGVMQLAAASGMDLASASDMVTDYLSAFNLEAADATRMADMLAYAQAHSNTTAEQLGEAYGNCAAGLNTAGQSIDTVTAMLEAMANQGTKGSEAGTALNAIMSQITQKMKDGAIQIGDTAVAVQDSEGNFRDLTDILGDVEAATDGMGTAQKSAALAAVFNRTSLSGINQILNEGIDKVRGYRDELNNSQGAAQGMADIMNDNLQGALTEANSAAEGLGIALYDQVSGPLTDAVRIGTGLINKITDAITPQKSALDGFIEDIEKQNETVRGLIDNASDSANNAEIYAAKLDGYKNVLLEVAGATEQTEFQKYQVEQIVKELGGAIPELAEAWDSETGSLQMNREEITRLMDSYQNAVLMQAYTDALAESQRALAEATIAQMKAETAHTKAAEELKTAMESGAEGVEVLTNRKEGYTKISGELVDREREAAEALADSNKNMEDAQDEVDLMSQAYDALKQKCPELAAELEATGDSASDSADDIKEETDAIQDLDEEHVKEVKKAFQDMEKGIGDAVKSSISFFEEFNGGSDTNLDTVIGNLESQVEGLSKWKENMETLAEAAGSGMTQEFYDYLVEMGPKSANLVQELVDSLEGNDGDFEKVVQTWTEAMELSDTSQILATYTTAGQQFAEETGAGFEGGISGVKSTIESEMQEAGEEGGKAMGEGLADGIEGTEGEVTSAAEGVATSAKTTTEGKTGEYTQTGQKLMQSMATGMTNEKGNVSKAAGDVANDANTTAFSKATFFNNTGQKLMQSMAAGMTGNKTTVTSAAGSVASEASNTAGGKTSEFSRAGSSLSGALGTGIRNGKSTVTSAASAVASAAASSANGYKGSFSSAGKNMSSGLASGIRAGKSSAISAAVEVAKAALNAAKRELGISSPSREFEKVGMMINQGWANGITKSQKTVEEALSKSSKKIIDAENKDAKRLQKQYEKDFGAKRTDDKGNKNKNYYSDYLRGAEKALDQYKTMQDMSAEEELKYWKTIQKNLKKRSDEWYDVQKKINGLKDDISDEKKEKKEEEREKKREEKEKKREEKEKKKKQKEEEEARKEEQREERRQKREEAAKAKVEERKTLRSVQDKILDDYKVYHDLPLKAEAQYWNKARKQFKKGTAERIEADQKYYEAKKAYEDRVHELKEEELANEQEINQQLEDSIAGLTQAYEDAVSERKNSILQSMSLFEDWDSSGYTADVLTKNLQHQVEGLKLWESEMKSLNAKNLPAEFVEELEAMGPDATASIYSLNRMTAGELQEYIGLWEERRAIAEREAERENEALKKATDEQIAAEKALANDRITGLRDQLKSDLAEIRTEIGDDLSDMIDQAVKISEDGVAALIAGIANPETMEGFRKSAFDCMATMGNGLSGGLASTMPTLTETSATAIDNSLAAMKKRSKASKALGADMAERVAAGIEKSTGKVSDSMKLMITTAMDSAYSELDAEWSARGLGGIRALNALISPTGKTGAGISKDPTQENLENLLKQVALIGELLTQTQLVMDTGQIVGALQPALSQEQAAVAVRRNRGTL